MVAGSNVDIAKSLHILGDTLDSTLTAWLKLVIFICKYFATLDNPSLAMSPTTWLVLSLVLVWTRL